MSAIQQALLAAGVASTLDPYIANVVLLVDASNFTNGSTPSTIDVQGKTPTYRGNAQVKTDQFAPLTGATSSLYFDGTNDRISFPDGTDFTFGTGDVTVEMWVRPEGTFSSGNRIAISQAASFGGTYSVQIYRNTGDLITVGITESDGVTTRVGTGGTITSDAWSHVALIRSGANLYRALNGTVGLITSSLSGAHDTIIDSTGAMTLGAYVDADGSLHWKGWIDQVRITKGVARYTANFSVPTVPFSHT